jgi:hypothetical protein
MSMLEIYNESVNDLLSEPAKRGETKKALDIRQVRASHAGTLMLTGLLVGTEWQCSPGFVTRAR